MTNPIPRFAIPGITLLLTISAIGASKGELRAQAAVRYVSEFIWRGRCGVESEDTDNRVTLYCLNSPSPHGYRVSDDFSSVVKKWIAQHPRAYLLPVFSIPLIDDASDEIQVYSWVVDGDSNLNLDLVRMGVCPGSMMKLQNGYKPVISLEKYGAFIANIDKAEDQAKRLRLGIWEKHNAHWQRFH